MFLSYCHLYGIKQQFAETDREYGVQAGDGHQVAEGFGIAGQ